MATFYPELSPVNKSVVLSMFVYDFHKQHVMQLILNDERKEFKEKEMYKET